MACMSGLLSDIEHRRILSPSRPSFLIILLCHYPSSRLVQGMADVFTLAHQLRCSTPCKRSAIRLRLRAGPFQAITLRMHTVLGGEVRYSIDEAVQLIFTQPPTYVPLSHYHFLAAN